METIITITTDINNLNDYSIQDRILKNIITGDYEVFYSGQNQGRLDYQLVNAVNSLSTFRVYYRSKNNLPFIFLGHTNYSRIVNERTIAKGIDTLPNERLQIKLIIPEANIINILVVADSEGVGCYKKAILDHSGFSTNVNINLGFYTRL
jgi:hypothetical protein